MDIRKFYFRINRMILKNLVEKKIKDQKFVDLTVRFAEQSDPFGIPVGNLLSQLFALIYLNPFDHWIKREMKTNFYVRYVDDSIVFNLSKERAKDLLSMIRAFLWENLGLTLSKFRIASVKKGVNFVGFRTWRSKRFVRKHSLYRFSKSLKRKDTKSLTSILANAKKTSSMKHLRFRVSEETPQL